MKGGGGGGGQLTGDEENHMTVSKRRFKNQNNSYSTAGVHSFKMTTFNQTLSILHLTTPT